MLYLIQDLSGSSRLPAGLQRVLRKICPSSPAKYAPVKVEGGLLLNQHPGQVLSSLEMGPPVPSSAREASVVTWSLQ